MRTKLLGLAIVLGTLGLIGPERAAAQAPNPFGAPGIFQQTRFVQFLLVRQQQFINLAASRLVQSQTFAGRINEITGQVPQNPFQARQIQQVFNTASRLLARFNAQSAFLNARIQQQQLQANTQVDLLAQIDPGNPALPEFQAVAQAQTQAVQFISTATPAMINPPV